MHEEFNIHPEAPASATPSVSTATLVAGAAVLGGAALLSGARPAQAQTSRTVRFSDIPGSGDIKVLNYALALEALEAELYRQAFARLTTGGTDNLGQPIVGLGLTDSNAVVPYIRSFGVIENQHRDFLTAALGAEALTSKAPFSTVKFDFKIQSLDLRGVVDLVLLAEQTGVQAYIGAIPFFKTKTFLQTAAAIQGTEARHTAALTAISNRLFNEQEPTAPQADDNSGIDKPLTPDAVLGAVSKFFVFA
jgi:hypothetical protein